MKRNTAHGRSFIHTAGFTGKSKFEFLGNQYSIVKEHLVEISDAVEKKAVGILLLGLEVILHHGGYVVNVRHNYLSL